jgi:hypothetical protein
MLHYLRIAVTALSLTACVLLFALWVRSYSSIEVIRGKAAGYPYLMESSGGGARVILYKVGTPSNTWSVESRANVNMEGPPIGFDWMFTAKRFMLGSPYWFLMLSGIGIAVVPWLPLPRRFSLRTLLIATTLFAVVLGVIAFNSTTPTAQPPIDVGDFGSPIDVMR